MRRVGVVALGVVWSAVATAAPAPRDVGLAEALAAVGAAPDHRVAAARADEAEAGVAAAGAWPRTTLGASTTSRTAWLDLVAALPLPVFGTLEADRAVARGELAVAAAEVHAGDLQLAREVAIAWFALARAEARAELARQSAAREDALAGAAQKRLDSGDASRADVVLATAAAKRVGAQAAAADGAIDVASAELAARLGWDPTRRLHAAGGLPAGPDGAAPAAVAHPELVAARRRAEAQQAEVDRTSRERWPRLALDLESAIGDPTLAGTDYRVGLTVELPLFGHGAASVRAAEARLATTRAAGAAVSARLGAELAAARARFATASQLAASLAADVLPAQREAAELARAAFREGQAGLVFVLEAERGLAEVEGEAIDARAEAATAFVELEWASGTVR